LKVVDAAGQDRASTTAAQEACLVFRSSYNTGDRLVVETSRPGYLVLALDCAMGAALVYMNSRTFVLDVPFGAKRACYPPFAFQGELHRLCVRQARPDEIAGRRNLALNPFDDHGNASVFPHASANVETRREAAFAARNAIDGEKANDDHGFWPYTSWGINRDPEATLTLEFGRAVVIDEIVLYLRADFPHDAWWEKASIDFSNGQVTCLSLIKSGGAQTFALSEQTVEWIRLHSLVKAADPSPFPALTQIEVWGREAR
jgi:hypothetical protein